MNRNRPPTKTKTPAFWTGLGLVVAAALVLSFGAGAAHPTLETPPSAHISALASSQNSTCPPPSTTPTTSSTLPPLTSSSTTTPYPTCTSGSPTNSTANSTYGSNGTAGGAYGRNSTTPQGGGSPGFELPLAGAAMGGLAVFLGRRKR